ncbi:DUF6282 family protein [Nocardioides sp. AN3]
MTDLHVHASPSLMPRHGNDGETVAAEQAQGISTIVLKAHEGSTVERAALAGENVYGGIVLNSPVGGANPDAVEVAARLGGRVVWMPTVSSPNHQASSRSPELAVHSHVTLRAVGVVEDGRLRAEWYDVLDAVAHHDLLLGSGHLSVEETVVVFTEARKRGVERLLVNHPKMAFMHWADPLGPELRRLGAHLELGILPDLLTDPPDASLSLVGHYPNELLVFGADLGHADHPAPAEIVPGWLRKLERHAGAKAAAAITTGNSRQLLAR